MISSRMLADVMSMSDWVMPPAGIGKASMSQVSPLGCKYMKTGHRHRPGQFWAGCLCLIFLFSGCALPTNAPLKSLFYPRPLDDGSRGLIVFLRGWSGSNTDFAENGFVAAVNRRRLPFAMIAPDAHRGYYIGETLVPRLKHDLIEPSKISGYSPVWLAGVSMGGLGALMYLRAHPEDIAGVCLISPFLGYPGIISEISAAGSLTAWDPGQFDPRKDWERMLWAWLKETVAAGKIRAPIYLGYGDKDSFLRAHQLLAQALPADHVRRVPGGHDPETMIQLWALFLDSPALHNNSR